MSEPRIRPDQSEPLPPYFERNAADVRPEEWPTYEPLAYEVWMLEAVARRLAALPADESLPDEDRPLKNALLESFALHFRNLAEFFWPSKHPRPTDVAIGHFTQGGSPNEPRPDHLIDREVRPHLVEHGDGFAEIAGPCCQRSGIQGAGRGADQHFERTGHVFRQPFGDRLEDAHLVRAPRPTAGKNQSLAIFEEDVVGGGVGLRHESSSLTLSRTRFSMTRPHRPPPTAIGLLLAFHRRVTC